MGFLKFSKDKAVEADKGFGLIEPGDYEMFVSKAEWRTKNQKTPNFNLSLVIRTDVDQDYKGRSVFHSFYISKDAEKVETSMNMLQAFLHKIGATDGMDFTTEQEVAAFMVGKAVVGTVDTEEYNGKKNSRIQGFTVSDLLGRAIDTEAGKKDTTMSKAADKKDYTRVDEDPFANDGKTIDISDDDLPF
jgi:hypothetical protein